MLTNSSERIAQEAKLNLLSSFALAVLIFSVTRGLVPLLTQNAVLTQPTYHAASGLGVLLSCYGLYVAVFRNSLVIGKWLRNVLIINLFLHFVWIAPLILFKPQYEVLIGIAYTGLFPFSVYALIQIPERIVAPVLSFLAVIVSAFVILDFISINTLLIPGGVEQAYDRQILLRPDSFEGYGRGAGEVMRPVGLLGSRPHDAGNLLAILFVYALGMLFRIKKHAIPTAVVTVLALLGLLLAQTATNILAAFVGVAFVLLAYRRILFSAQGIFPLLVLFLVSGAVAWGMALIEFDLDLILAWSKRVSGEGDWESFLSLGAQELGADLFAILFGHGGTLELSENARFVEIGLLKTLMEFGLVHALLFYSLLLYPCGLFVFRKFGANRYLAVPYVAAVGVGFLSLLHYGSVLRTTNIFVFFALYAQALRIFVDAKNAKRAVLTERQR